MPAKHARINIRATPAEKVRFQEAAARAGTTLSRWIRACLHKAALPPVKG